MQERRRKVLKAGFGACAAAAAAVAAPAIAQGKRELKMVLGWPRNSPGNGTAIERFAQNVTKATDGRITFRIYGANELVPVLGMFDAVSKGAVDVANSTGYYWTGKSKAYNFFSTVPFGMLPMEHFAWLTYGGGQKLWDELNAPHDLKSLPLSQTGAQMGGWYRKEVKGLADLKGLKARYPGFGGEILKTLGATPVLMPLGEVFPALQSGALDAAELATPWFDMGFGLYKVAKFYYSPGFHEPGHTLELMFNKKVWDSLSPSDQTLITIAAHAELMHSEAEVLANDPEALDQLTGKYGVQLRTFPDDVLRAMQKAAAEIIPAAVAEDPMAKKVYESYASFQKKVQPRGILMPGAVWRMRSL
ncbi:MAG: TRAP transporter substrate-binding protein [Burkholderiales bacterium]|jgi:TRAP-type mannitol/chloroaromatic compound transport system substrate-binding protein|nr:TRAP transporter substrate-binding protein [Burkholderiales bacterium]